MIDIEYRLATIGGNYREYIDGVSQSVRYYGNVDAGLKRLELIAEDFSFNGRCTDQKIDLNFYGKYAF
jgi:hypothetical protein